EKRPRSSGGDGELPNLGSAWAGTRERDYAPVRPCCLRLGPDYEGGREPVNRSMGGVHRSCGSAGTRTKRRLCLPGWRYGSREAPALLCPGLGSPVPSSAGPAALDSVGAVLVCWFTYRPRPRHGPPRARTRTVGSSPLWRL